MAREEEEDPASRSEGAAEIAQHSPLNHLQL
jgi:hypothetical protein